MKTLKPFFYGLLLFAAAGCGTTARVTSSWSLPEPPANAMNKVLVLGVFQNMEQKQQIEEAMASTLNQTGIRAQSAFSLFGPAGFRGLGEEEIITRLKGSDFTSVMIVSLIDREQTQNYIPGNYYASPHVLGYNRFYRRYVMVNDWMYTPGYYTTNTTYVLQAEIYTIEGDELVYSAQTQSYDPANYRDLAVAFSRSIIAELQAKRLIPAT